jgi:hypothetical protein
MVIEIGPIAPSSIGQQKEIKFILVTIWWHAMTSGGN